MDLHIITTMKIYNMTSSIQMVPVTTNLLVDQCRLVLGIIFLVLIMNSDSLLKKIY